MQPNEYSAGRIRRGFAATSTSQQLYPNMAPFMNNTVTEFVYQNDMDENGALYFLGTNGRKRLYQNPA